MSLEATMIILDNSDFSRNGDYYPTRWESQKDSLSLLSNAKFNSNPESMVGVALMAGAQVQILTSPTDEQTRIMALVHNVPLAGRIKLTTALSICQLALKHRLNKSQRQRCIVFLASPIDEDLNTLVTLAKKLKRNDIAVDFINLGHDENLPKIEAFINTINKDDNSHFLNVQPGQLPLSDQLIGSSILGGQSGFNEFGIDPNMDPEIAEAIRLSLQEEKERQEKDKQKLEKKEQQDLSQQPQQMEVINELMKVEDENLDEEELLNRAKQLSMQEQGQEPDAFQDQKFVDDLLNSIPGADPNSEEVKKALEDLKKKEQKDKK